MICEERQQELQALCRSLIEARSYSGEEGEIARKIEEYCKAAGYTDVHVDRYGNCIGHIKGRRPGPAVLFDGHMDTVPVPDSSVWQEDPFGAEVKGGRIYGRGSSDMKGALSAMLKAAEFYAKDLDYDFPGDIYVAGVVHEECFEGVAAREISSYVKPDYVIIGEASQLNIKIGQRGRAELQVETFGRPAHSASPDEGINAVYQMAAIIGEIRKLKPPHHPVLGDGILELVDIKSAPYPGASVVPDYCRATYDRRLLVGETKEDVLKPVEELLERMMKADPVLKAKVSYVTASHDCYTGEVIESERFFPGWLYSREEQFVRDVYQEMKELGFDPEITNYDFCTNASHYAGEAGIKTLGVGPSKETLAHTIDEYIETEQLFQAAECYYGIMKALLK